MPTLLRILLIVAAAACGTLAFPPFDLGPLAIVGLALLLASLAGLRPGRAMLAGLLHGMLLFAGTLNWLWALFGPIALQLFLILACFHGLFGLAYAALARRQPGPIAAALLVGVAWTGTEFFRGEWFTLRFPWITPATALEPHLLTPVIGAYGTGFLIAAATAYWIHGGPRHARSRCLPLIAVILLSLVPPPMPAAAGGEIRVAAVQGEGLAFDEYIRLSDSAEGAVDAIVWPEYSVPDPLAGSPDELAAIRALMERKECRLVVVGTTTRHDAETWSNTALSIGRRRILGSHFKNRPVHFFNDGLAGTEAVPKDTPLGPVATTICFDNDYMLVPRRAAAAGAGLFLVPSMDAMRWTARQHLQHAELARQRAAETGRWFVVASSSGVTQIVDPRGRQVAALPLGDPGVLVGEVAPLTRPTFHTRAGWLIGPACTVACVILLVWLAATRPPSGRVSR